MDTRTETPVALPFWHPTRMLARALIPGGWANRSYDALDEWTADVDRLLAEGADPSFSNSYLLLLHVNAMRIGGNSEEGFQFNLRVLDKLISAGAEIGAAHQAALRLAVYQNQPAVVRALLSRGADATEVREEAKLIGESLLAERPDAFQNEPIAIAVKNRIKRQHVEILALLDAAASCVQLRNSPGLGRTSEPTRESLAREYCQKELGYRAFVKTMLERESETVDPVWALHHAMCEVSARDGIFGGASDMMSEDDCWHLQDVGVAGATAMSFGLHRMDWWSTALSDYGEEGPEDETQILMLHGPKTKDDRGTYFARLVWNAEAEERPARLIHGRYFQENEEGGGVYAANLSMTVCPHALRDVVQRSNEETIRRRWTQDALEGMSDTIKLLKRSPYSADYVSDWFKHANRRDGELLPEHRDLAAAWSEVSPSHEAKSEKVARKPASRPRRSCA